MRTVLTVNVGQPQPNPYKDTRQTGMGKSPVTGPVEVRAPGPKHGGLGSGLVGDFVGDRKHHGGDDQAVYAFAREDLDRWAERLGRELPNGAFGENLTTAGFDVNDARVGEVWRVGAEVELTVTDPRTPCATFRGWMGERGWLRTFTADQRTGTYLRVRVPGRIASGDPIEVLHRPNHGVTVAQVFRALMVDRAALADLWPAWDDLTPGVRELLAASPDPR